MAGPYELDALLTTGLSICDYDSIVLSSSAFVTRLGSVDIELTGHSDALTDKLIGFCHHLENLSINDICIQIVQVDVYLIAFGLRLALAGLALAIVVIDSLLSYFFLSITFGILLLILSI